MGKWFEIVNEKGRDWKFIKDDRGVLTAELASPHYGFYLDDVRVATVWKDRYGWGFYDQFGVSGVVYGFKTRHRAMDHCLDLCKSELSHRFDKLDREMGTHETDILRNTISIQAAKLKVLVRQLERKL